MKKLILAIILAVGCLTGANAQSGSILENPSNAPYFGLRAALDISCPSNVKSGVISMDLYKPGAGFEIGGIYNIPLWKNLYFEPALSLYYNTMGMDVDILDAILDVPYNANYSVRRFGFRIPFAVGYRFDFDGVNVSVFTGPEVNIGLIGREHLSYNKTGESNNIYDDGLKRFDLGWRFGASIGTGRYIFGIYGTAGMVNMLSDSNGVSYHDNNVAIFAGYNF